MCLVVSLCAHCRFISEYIPNVIVKNILSTVSQGSKCTRNVITGFQHPSPPVTFHQHVRLLQPLPTQLSSVCSAAMGKRKRLDNVVKIDLGGNPFEEEDIL